MPGLRRSEWRPPQQDPWRSNYNYGLIGTRRLAYRSHSSFKQWDMDDETGRVHGMIQQDFPNPDVPIPLDRAVLVTFGDPNNPEGVALLETIWRLERLKYGLEVIQGIGYEHAAGFLNVNTEQQLSLQISP